MISAREEAASIVMPRNRMYIMGGLIDKNPSRDTEVLTTINGAWEAGFSLPECKYTGNLSLLKHTLINKNHCNSFLYISYNMILTKEF